MNKPLLFLGTFLLVILTIPLTATAASNNAAEEARTVSIDVMSFNIHTGIGTDGVYNLDRTAEIIQDSGADVIGLQEVDVHWSGRSNFDDQVAYLADKLDMHAFFAPIYDQDPFTEEEPRRQYGVAVLSKYPFTKAENRQITRLSTQNASPEPSLAPGFAEVEINAKGAKFSFYVTHLDYRGDSYIREMQVDDMLAIIPEENAVLVGDMNASPEAPELQPLFERFQDAWTEGNGYTFPAETPESRIDYILLSRDITVSNTQVIQTTASDHLPVISEITLQRGNN